MLETLMRDPDWYQGPRLIEPYDGVCADFVALMHGYSNAESMMNATYPRGYAYPYDGSLRRRRYWKRVTER